MKYPKINENINPTNGIVNKSKLFISLIFSKEPKNIVGRAK